MWNAHHCHCQDYIQKVVGLVFFFSVRTGFGISGTGLCSAPLTRMAVLPSAPPWWQLSPPCRAPSPPQDTACPREKIAQDYIMKDRFIMCMHKRAKYRSCRQFCNDLWLLNFFPAPTLLPTKRPYSPFQPPLFCFLSFLFLTHPCPFTE